MLVYDLFCCELSCCPEESLLSIGFYFNVVDYLRLKQGWVRSNFNALSLDSMFWMILDYLTSIISFYKAGVWHKNFILCFLDK